MMKLMFIFMVLFSLTSWAGGGYVGNGGDGIQCRKDQANRLEGIYALDYIATLPTLDGDDGLHAVNSWNESSKRLISLLRNKAPSLAQSFEHFVSLMYNKSYAQDRIWEASPFGLIKLDDQKLTNLIPKNCVDGESAQIIQAVIRLYEPYAGTDPGHIIYKYDPALLEQLDRAAPLQLSFLLVHEWLWDLSTNVERNRRVNRFLHSLDAETMTAADFIAELKGMGLQIPNLQADEFSESSCQGYPITKAEFEERYASVYEPMLNWGAVKVSRRERAATCSPTRSSSCDLSWHEVRHDRNTFIEHPYFLSPTWKSNDLSKPLKILSPRHIASRGSSLLPGVGEMACRFNDDGIYNLECEIRDPDLIQPLLNARGDYNDVQHAPKLKAVLTHECFRLTSTAIVETTVIDTQGSSATDYSEIETVLSVRAARGDFMPPRSF